MVTLTEFREALLQLPPTVQLLLSLVGLLLLLFGWLLGWLVQRRKTRRTRKAVGQLERERDDFRERLKAADEEQQNLAREVVQLTTAKDESLLQLQNTRQTLSDRKAELDRLRAREEQLMATNSRFATTIEDLNDQVIGLKTRNEHLLGQADGSSERIPSALERRVADLEIRMEKLMRPSGTPPPEERLILEHPGHRVTIGPSAEEEATTSEDDLTRIEAIGPFNARQLAEAGISRYRQIADWSEDDIDRYANEIGYPAELIRQADWVGLARQFAHAD
jgi:chromosome segregation ATPase